MPAEVFPALRYAIDRSEKKGRFVLTASANPALVRAVSESLAGRIGLLEVKPFSAHELRAGRLQADRWFWGGYPPVLGLRAAWANRTIVKPELSFWRTQAGAEVDLLIADGRRIVPVEIKLGAAVDGRSLHGLRQCMADFSLRRGFVVYTGTERRTLDGRIDLVPWDDVQSGAFEA